MLQSPHENGTTAVHVVSGWIGYRSPRDRQLLPLFTPEAYEILVRTLKHNSADYPLEYGRWRKTVPPSSDTGLGKARRFSGSASTRQIS